MKTFLKTTGALLLILLVTFFMLGLTQDKDVTITKQITMKAPQGVVFNQVVRFKNWPNWSPWIEVEPAVKITYDGVDGQPGSSYTWLGDETGSGKMTNTKVKNGQMNFDLLFIKPWEGHADGFLKTENKGGGATEIVWSMTIHSKFPMNAINFITGKMVAKDLERGLELLKAYTEANPTFSLSAADITEKDFPATTFAIIRKKVPFTEMKDFSSKAFNTLSAATESRRSGSPCTFYFDWDEKTQTAEIAPAFPVNGTAAVAGAEILTIPAMHVCSILHKGGYSNMGETQKILGQYIAEKGKKFNYNYEEYLIGPANEPDSNKWVTNINFVVN